MGLFGGVEEPEIDYRALYDDYRGWLDDAQETRDYSTGNLNQQIQSAIVRGHSPDSAYVRNLRERGQADIDEAYAGSVNSLEQGVTFQNLKGFGDNAINRINVANNSIAGRPDPFANNTNNQRYAGDAMPSGPMGTGGGTYSAGDTYNLSVAGGLGGNREYTVEDRPEREWQLEGGGNDIMGYLDNLYGRENEDYEGAGATGGYNPEPLSFTRPGQSQLNQGGA